MQLMKTLVIILITALCALFFMRAAPAEVVYIPDADLRAAILKKLNSEWCLDEYDKDFTRPSHEMVLPGIHYRVRTVWSDW